MRVLKVEPYQVPEVKDIEPGLASLQHEVEGSIETYYPSSEDPVTIICNEEGKLNGMEYNRAIRDEKGEVREIIADQLNIDPEEITMDTNVTKDLEADSLDAVEIIVAIEDEYDIEIPEDQAEQFQLVSNIVKYVEDNSDKA